MNTHAILLLRLLGPGLASAADDVKAADPDKKKWISLFDGKSLAGWVPKIAGYEVGENFVPGRGRHLEGPL